MKNKEILRKVEANEGLTVEEIILYQKEVKPVKHVYGKYGTLAKKYLEEHNFGKYLSLGGDLPTYLHNIDKQAEEIYEVMYKNLSAKPENKKTEDFLKNVQIENSIQKEIEEVILNELIYVE